jgi:hypothetical protein
MASMPYAQYLRMSHNEDNYLDFVKKLHKKGLIESEKDIKQAEQFLKEFE